MVPDAPAYVARSAQVCRKLNVGQDELAVLEWGCCCQISREFDQVMDLYGVTQKAGILSVVTGIPLKRLRGIVSTKGILSRNGLFSLEKSRVMVDEDVFDYLIGNAGADFAVDAYELVTEASLGLDAFTIRRTQRDALVRMVGSEGAFNILFYGMPGTGKTELSRSISVHCDCPAVMVSCGVDGDRFDRKKALLTAVNSVPEGAIIIVDEADTLLAAHDLFRRVGPNKAWINLFMDTNRHKMIWIINDISELDESIRRRFAYSIRFESLGVRQRGKIWESQLRAYRIKRFFKAEKVVQLANRYVVSPGVIAYAIRTVAQCMESNWAAPKVNALLSEVLDAQVVLAGGTRNVKKLKGLTEHFDQAALNTDTDTHSLLEGLRAMPKQGGEEGVNLLFWGWPGTGKTEFAKYLAKQMGKELLVRRISDLQDKFLGETEKNIAQAFRHAGERGAILFLDEADSLFINRQTADRSWEISQTNEILTQMENFAGILICCTNLLGNLDEAAMRRFAFRIKFLPLTEEGKLRLYRQYFSFVRGSFSSQQELRLSKLRNLCPGDIKAVWQRMRILGKTTSHDAVINELEKEVGYKVGCSRVPIGFQ